MGYSKRWCKTLRGHLVVGYRDGFYERWALQDAFSSKSGEGILGKRRHEHSADAGEHGVCSDKGGHSVCLEHRSMQGSYRRQSWEDTRQRSSALIWEAVGNHCGKAGMVRPLGWEEGGSQGRVGYKKN